jgi:hypothetical protein
MPFPGPRMAERDLPQITAIKIVDLRTCMLALRAWARDEGLDNPQLTTAIETAGIGRAEKEVFKQGFSELLLLLSEINPSTIVDAEMPQAGLRTLGLGVAVYGRFRLARFHRKRSAGALAAIQARSASLESLDEDKETLMELGALAELLLTRLIPSTSPTERIYPGLFELRQEIEGALQPSALEEIAKAKVSGELQVITDEMIATVKEGETPPSPAAEISSKTRIPVILRPSIGVALHGLVIWSRKGSFLPEVDKAIRKVDFPHGLRSWFERGASILSVLPPGFDPVDLAEAEVDDAGMVAAAMGTLVYAALVRQASEADVPDIDSRAAEAAEFAAYLVMCLNAEASAHHPDLIQRLARLRRERERHETQDQERTGSTRTRWKMPAISLPDMRNTGPLLQIIGGVAVLALGLTVFGRYWTNRGPPLPTSYEDIVEVTGMIRTPGLITVRLHEFRLGETRADQAYSATALWFRLTSEENDTQLRLNIESNLGKPIAVVSAGSVEWATP